MPFLIHMLDHGGMQVLETTSLSSMSTARSGYVCESVPTWCQGRGDRPIIRLYDLLEGTG